MLRLLTPVLAAVLPSFSMSRGVLIRIRHDQLLSEPRPHILTGIEDPHSGAVGASTVEKDDYDDELVFMDDPEERKKVVSSRPDILDDEKLEPLLPPEEVVCSSCLGSVGASHPIIDAFKARLA